MKVLEILLMDKTKSKECALWDKMRGLLNCNYYYGYLPNASMPHLNKIKSYAVKGNASSS